MDGDYHQGKPGTSAFEGMDDPSVLREKVAEVARTGRSYQYVVFPFEWWYLLLM